MYRVETRIPHYELVREFKYALRKALPVSFEGIREFLGGEGEIERYEDFETLEVVIAGTRNVEFPWQAWPLEEVGNATK